jgi:hypothetical protein
MVVTISHNLDLRLFTTSFRLNIIQITTCLYLKLQLHVTDIKTDFI